MKSIFPSRTRVAKIVGSPKFFKGIIVLLVLQAAWIAFSGRYPMAFDEDFHLGVIRLYAHHLSPFWSVHPSGGDAFGAVARDPSYLYHYLMSFPYRIINFFTDSQSIQVLILRGLNIALFAGGLPLYRRLLRKTGASRAIVHFCLLLFVLVPIVPLLAAQINYDNLILPLTALTLLLTISLRQSLSKKTLDVGLLLLLTSLCLLTSLVKYAYLPILLAIVAYLLVGAWRTYGGLAALSKAAKNGWQQLKTKSRWGLIALLVVSGGLFVERYGLNLIRYHTPVPDCAQVLDYQHCQHYPPWIRDYNFELGKPAVVQRSPVAYSQHWLYGMWFRSFFAVDGPASDFQTRGPLTMPAVSSIVLVAAGLGAFVLRAKRVWRRYNGSVLWLFTATAAVHISILWLQDYQLFVQTGQPVAINGRYLLPVLPLLVVMTALALRELLGQRERLQLVLATGILICFLWGGGALTYILRSNDAWYWPSTPFKTANHAVHSDLGPITPGYRQPTQYLH